MGEKKTLEARTKELQALQGTEEGRAQLRDLVAHYGASSGQFKAERTSAITYILVHERHEGLIAV